MIKLNFDYNLKKDAWSWVLIAKDRDMWGLNWRDQIAQIPDELLEKIEKVSFFRAQKIVENVSNISYYQEIRLLIIESDFSFLYFYR